MAVHFFPFFYDVDYAVHIFHEVAKTGRYKCFLKKDTRLPMIYIDDCLDATVQLMEAPAENLSLRTYNVHAISFTPEMLVNEIKKYYPEVVVEYEVDKDRQKIGKQLILGMV